MNDRAAFLAAIIADRDNDLPRLIYADYLDEHGEPERAAFIRVQCGLARLVGRGPDPETPPWCWHVADLRRRERELKRPYDLSWHIHWRREKWIHYPAGQVFRRGFVEEITCSWEDWRTHAAAIMAATPLRKVRLTNMPTILIELRNGQMTALEGTADVLAQWPTIEFELPTIHPNIEFRPLPEAVRHEATPRR